MEKWCEHFKTYGGCFHFTGGASDVRIGDAYCHDWKLCPICGTPSPKEQSVELPEKIGSNYYTGFETVVLVEKVDKILDYLASKPWEKK